MKMMENELAIASGSTYQILAQAQKPIATAHSALTEIEIVMIVSLGPDCENFNFRSPLHNS
jgi:hypothetical protein